MYNESVVLYQIDDSNIYIYIYIWIISRYGTTGLVYGAVDVMALGN